MACALWRQQYKHARPDATTDGQEIGTMKTITAEKEGEFSITVEYDDLTERTFDGVRRMTPNDIGVVQTHWYPVLVVADGVIHNFVVRDPAGLDELGSYFKDIKGALPKMTLCICEMCADPTQCDVQSMAG